MKKSFINCSDSNADILEDLIRLLNAFKSGNSEQTFIEPFVGSGVVFLNMEKYNNFIINDTNVDIFILFQNMKNNKETLLEDIKNLNKQTNDINHILQKYYKTSNYYEKCKLFVILNSYGINYEQLENSETIIGQSTKFFNDFSLKKIDCFVEKLNNNCVSIFNYSFERIFENLEYGDVVYCDPPDINCCFNAEQHKLLNKLAFTASLKGIKVVISNKYNEMNKELYKDCSEYYIKRIKTSDQPKEEMIAIYA